MKRGKGRLRKYDTSKFCVGQDPRLPMMQHIAGVEEFLVIVDEDDHKEWDVIVGCMNCGHDMSFRSVWDNTLGAHIELVNMANPDLPQIELTNIITSDDLKGDA